MTISPDELLTWYAARTARDGYVCPQLDSRQAYDIAATALGKLGAAAGLVRPEPAREPAALTASPAVGPVDEATRLLPVVRPADPRYAERLYAAGRSGA